MLRPAARGSGSVPAQFFLPEGRLGLGAGCCGEVLTVAFQTCYMWTFECASPALATHTDGEGGVSHSLLKRVRLRRSDRCKGTELGRDKGRLWLLKAQVLFCCTSWLWREAVEGSQAERLCTTLLSLCAHGPSQPFCLCSSRLARNHRPLLSEVIPLPCL